MSGMQRDEGVSQYTLGNDSFKENYNSADDTLYDQVRMFAKTEERDKDILRMSKNFKDKYWNV